ncbi:hypothetical protein EMIT0P253_50014 [Pseudomonas sp. IT-P253]
MLKVLRIDAGAKFTSSDRSAESAGILSLLLKLGYMPSLHEHAYRFGRFSFARKNLRPQLEKQVYETTVRHQVFDPRSGTCAREWQRSPVAA